MLNDDGVAAKPTALLVPDPAIVTATVFACWKVTPLATVAVTVTVGLAATSSLTSVTSTLRSIVAFAASSSVTVAVTDPCLPEYLESDDATAWVMFAERLPPVFTTLSSTPVTVTVWGVLQFCGVNVSVAEAPAAPVVLTAAAAAFADLAVTVTSCEGATVNATVYVSVPPFSATVVSPLDSAIVSLSVHSDLSRTSVAP